MITINIPLSQLEPNRGQVEGLPKNPRILRDERFKALKKSIEDDPEMLELRELLVYPTEGGQYVVIGGNMRLRVLQDLKAETAPCKVIPAETPVEKLKAYATKDNVGFGDWDWDALANEWDAGDLGEWGVDFPGAEIDPIEPPALSDAPKPEFQQMTFTLHDTQAETVKSAMERAKAAGASESDVNENSNGNALAYIAAHFLNG